MDLILFLKKLTRKLWILILVPMLSGGLTFYKIHTSPKVYDASAEMSTGITDMSSVKINEEQNVQPFLISIRFSNLIEKMKSKSVISTLVYDIICYNIENDVPFKEAIEGLEALKKDKEKNLEILKKLKEEKKPLNPGDSSHAPFIYYAIENHLAFEHLVANINIDRVKDSDYIKIEFKSEDPLYSAYVVNTLCQNFIQYHEENILKSNESSVDFFAALAEKKRLELLDKLNKMKDFKLKNKIINLYEQTKAIVNQIKDLEIIRQNEHKNIPSYTAALENLNDRFESKDKFYRENTLVDKHLELQKLKDKINSLNSAYIKSGLTNKILKDSIDHAKQRLTRVIAEASHIDFGSPIPIRQDLVRKKLEYELNIELAKETVSSIDEEIIRLNKLVAGFAPMEAGISGFEKEISVASEVYLLILNKLNYAQFAAIEQKGRLSIVEYALVPRKAQPTQKALITILSAFVTFIITFAVIFIIFFFDANVKSPGQFLDKTKFKPTTLINYINRKDQSISELFSASSDDPDLKIPADQVRQLRNRLLLRDKKSILVTSTKREQGKSVCLTLLVHSFCLAGKSVCVIDGNPNEKSAKEYLQPDDPYILEEYFNAESKPELKSKELHTGSFTFFEIEGKDKTAVELFNNSLNELVEDMLSKFDVVLLETPAIFRKADFWEWQPVFSTVIPVFASNRIIEKAEEKVLDELHKMDIEEVVLNAIDMEYMENEVGETIKKRSGVRRFIKRLLRGSFEGRKSMANLKMML